GTLGPGEVFVYDRSTGALQSVAVIENAEGEWGAQVASLTVDPSSGELVVIDSRGVLSRRSLPSLAVQSETIGEVGAFSINEYTYAPPYVVSPLAYRADGAVTASTNVEGDIVVRWGDNEQVLPTPPNPMLSEWDERANVPVQIA